MQSVVITGVSTGIGNAIARVLAAHGFHVYGSVRKAADADGLRKALGDAFTPLVFDICDEVAVKAAAADVGRQLGTTTLAGLVNNAGIALGGPLLHQPVAEFRKQIDINITGQFIVTQAFAPLLGADTSRQGKPGRIVMISSDSGRVGAPFVGAYCASKHGLEGMAESLRRELMLFGIDVILVGPGFVATPIWDKAEDAATDDTYVDTPYAAAVQNFMAYMLVNGRKGHPPEKIGEAVLKALTVRSPKVRYAVVKGWIENWLVPKLLSRRTLDRILARQLGLKPQL